MHLLLHKMSVEEGHDLATHNVHVQLEGVCTGAVNNAFFDGPQDCLGITAHGCNISFFLVFVFAYSGFNY